MGRHAMPAIALAALLLPIATALDVTFDSRVLREGATTHISPSGGLLKWGPVPFTQHAALVTIVAGDTEVFRHAEPSPAHALRLRFSLPSRKPHTLTLCLEAVGGAQHCAKFPVRTAFTDSDLRLSGNWIAAPSPLPTVPLFSKTFKFATKPVECTLHIAGLGFYRAYANGVDVDGALETGAFGVPVLQPSWSNYEKGIEYDVKAVPCTSEVLQLEVLLGMGWRDTAVFPPRDGLPANDTHARVVLLVLEVNLGEIVREYGSDATWEVGQSNYVADSIYDGVTYDATRLPEAPEQAMVVPGPSGKLYLRTIPPMAIASNILYMETANRLKDGSWVFDFQENTAGVVIWLIPTCTYGQTISVRHAEVLQHPPYGPADGTPYYDNLRSAKATDTYICSGQENQTIWFPRFTYHGFRYIQIFGFNATDVAQIKWNFYKVRVNTLVSDNGYVVTGNAILNSINYNFVEGQRSNLMSVPTDCDQRDERLGWMGDASLSAQGMAINFELAEFHYDYWLKIIDEMQGGSLPDVVPFYRYGNRPADPSWSSAFTEIAYVLFNSRLVTTLESNQADALRDYIAYMVSRIPAAGLSQYPFSYGDWVPPPPAKKVDGHYTGAAAFLGSVQRAVEIFRMAKLMNDSVAMQQLYDDLVPNFQTAFSNGSTFSDGGQSALAIALSLPGVTVGFGETAAQLVAQIDNADGHIQTGIIGVKALFPALFQIGETELALAVLEQTDYPGFAFPIWNIQEPSVSSMWEIMNADMEGPSMNSRNHHMFSSPTHFIKTSLAGLEYSAEVGLRFSPARALGLAHVANVSVSSPVFASMAWRRLGGVHCAKLPEQPSTDSPALPLTSDLVVDCGAGRTVQSVDFATWGLPNGQCGAFTPGHCSSDVSSVVKSLCLGQGLCVLNASTPFWGDPCPFQVKRLYVQVTCSGPPAINATLRSTTPYSLVFPLTGITAPTVFANGAAGRQAVWSDGSFLSNSYFKLANISAVELYLESVPAPFPDVSVSMAAQPALQICGAAARGTSLRAACPPGMVFSGVVFASTGNPIGYPSLLQKDAVACTKDWRLQAGRVSRGRGRLMLRQRCVGRASCIVDDSFHEADHVLAFTMSCSAV